jgi:hypothetical protein
MKPVWTRQHAGAGAVLVISAMAFATMTLPHLWPASGLGRSLGATMLCATLVVAGIGAYAIVRGMRAPA